MESSSMGEKELFRRGGAELSLVVEGDESVLMQRGEFVLLLVKHASSPLAAVVAMVGDMQWPVGKDSLVLKYTENRYSFSLPAALTFALAFGPPADTVHLQQLDTLLRQYSTFAPRLPQAAGTSEIAHTASEFWTRFASDAEITDSTSNAKGNASEPVPMKELQCLSPRLAQKMLQARRMSAVEKLFARSVERGAINASYHVTMAEADESRHEQANNKVAVASVDAVAKVVEAVETAGKMLNDSLQVSSTLDCGKEQGKRAAVGSLITSAWTLNKIGLRMLFRTISSIQSRCSTSSSSGRSSSTSLDASGSLQVSSLSSSGSVSSTASKLPSAVSSCAADSASPSQVEYFKLSHSPTSHSIPRGIQAVGARFSSTSLGTTQALHGDGSMSASQGAILAQGAIRPLPLPPSFGGAAMPPPRLVGVAPAAAPAASAARPSSFHVYRMQPQPQPQQQPSPCPTAMSFPPSSVPWPPRPRHQPN